MQKHQRRYLTILQKILKIDVDIAKLEERAEETRKMISKAQQMEKGNDREVNMVLGEEDFVHWITSTVSKKFFFHNFFFINLNIFFKISILTLLIINSNLITRLYYYRKIKRDQHDNKR